MKDLEARRANNMLISALMSEYKYYKILNSGQSEISFSDTRDNKFYWCNNKPHIIIRTDGQTGEETIITIGNMLKDIKGFNVLYKEVSDQRLINDFNYKLNYGETLELNSPKLEYTNPDILLMIDKFNKSEKGVLAIQSAMGTGKSNLIEKILGNIDKRPVLFISPRKTFSSEVHNRYEDIIHYKQLQDWKKGDSLVCQVDSLHKVKNIDDFDIVIFDELESILEHYSEMCNRIMRDPFHISAVKDTLFEALKKKVIVCDACLRDRTISDMFCRGNFGYRDIFYIKNYYKDDVKLIQHRGWKVLTNKILSTLKYNINNNKVVTVSVTSLKYLKSIKKEIESKGYRVMTITSETSDDDKEALYKLISTNGAGRSELPYDVLMYSPTITVGVNILNDVSQHFHYDFGHSVSALASFQMIKRSRYAKVIHTYVKGCNKKGKIGYLSGVKECIRKYGTKYFTDADHVSFLTQAVNTFYSNNAKLVFYLMSKKGFKTYVQCE